MIKIADAGSMMKINLMGTSYTERTMKRLKLKIERVLTHVYEEWWVEIYEPMLLQRMIIQPVDYSNGLKIYPIINVNMARSECFIWIGCKFEDDQYGWKMDTWHTRNVKQLQYDVNMCLPPIFCGWGYDAAARENAKKNDEAKQFRVKNGLPLYK